MREQRGEVGPGSGDLECRPASLECRQGPQQPRLGFAKIALGGIDAPERPQRQTGAEGEAVGLVQFQRPRCGLLGQIEIAGKQLGFAQISGSWGADNLGTIFLNGVNTGITNGTFGFLSPFAINSGFVNGINTLTFQIQDFGPPLAFRVDNISGTADALTAAVPEPSTWAMMILGFAGGRLHCLSPKIEAGIGRSLTGFNQVRRSGLARTARRRTKASRR